MEAFWRKEITGAQLQRAFAQFKEWITPAIFDGTEPILQKFDFGKDDQGEADKHFFLFTDREAWAAYEEKQGKGSLGSSYLTANGSALFRNMDPDVKVLNINPHSPGQMHYKAAQFNALKKWADILEVERVLDTILQTGQGFAVLRDFKEYSVLGDPAGEGLSFANASDSNGRRLTAIFTADDALDAYVGQMNGEEPAVYTVPGKALFQWLKDKPLDGMVFNPLGPLPARAFALPFAEMVLTQELPE